MPDLSIIIVSWNCREYLEQCLRSIELSETRRTYNVIVVDNGSTDGTLTYLEQGCPDVRVISNTGNRGFAAANNQALHLAEGRFALFLNPDTTVHPGALDALIDCLDRFEHAWAVGPAMLNGDGSAQRTGVAFPTNWDIFVESLFLDRLFPQTRLFGRHRQLYEDPGRPRVVDYLQGSCLMVSSTALQKVGQLDERFFMYFEEADWCYRLKQSGGLVYYCPNSRVTHYGAGELGHFDERRLVFFHRSLLLFYRKHYSQGRLLILRVILLLRSLIRISVWSIVGTFKAELRKSATSSIRGYAKTLGFLFRET